MKKTKKKITASFEGSDIDLLAGNGHVQVKQNALFGPPSYIIERVPVSKAGHTFGPAPNLFPGQQPEYIVQDFILDQTGFSGCNGKMQPLKSFDLTTATIYAFQIYAKTRNKKIKVKPPASAGSVFIGLNVGRRYINAVSDVYNQSNAFAGFSNLIGTTPAFTYKSFFIGRNTNHWIEFVINADLVAPIVFSSFLTAGIYPARSFDPGLKNYKPMSHSLPFNLPGPDSVPYMLFSYRTTNPVDPGPFVFIS